MPLQNICCTCLSAERKLSQLHKFENGVTDLFRLILCETESNEACLEDVMMKELLVCWECCALLRRLSRFRQQATIARTLLANVADGKISASDIRCLSKLSNFHENWSNQELCSTREAPEQRTPKLLVDCGIIVRNIKMEIETDIPLEQLDDVERSLGDGVNKYGDKNGKREEIDSDRLEDDEIIDDSCHPIVNIQSDNVKQLQRKQIDENQGLISVNIPIASDEFNDNCSSTDSSDTDDNGDDNDAKVWSVNIPIANNEDNECYSSTEISDEDEHEDVIDGKDDESKEKTKIKNEIPNVTISVGKDEKCDLKYSTNDVSNAVSLENVESKKRIQRKVIVYPYGAYGNDKYNAMKALEAMSTGCNTETDIKLCNVTIPIEYSGGKSNIHKDAYFNSNRKEHLKNESTNTKKDDKLNRCYDIVKLSMEQTLLKVAESRSEGAFASAVHKCEQCVEIFDTCEQVDSHRQLHQRRPDHIECSVCHVFVPMGRMRGHRARHLLALRCRLCARVLRGLTTRTSDAARHLRERHLMQASYVDEQMTNIETLIQIQLSPKPEAVLTTINYSSLGVGVKIAPETTELSPLPKKPKLQGKKYSIIPEKKLKVILDDPKGRGYACIECNKYFKSRNRRSIHQQMAHGEGFQCTTCGKKFFSRNKLNSHEKNHREPPQRSPCAICGKAVRVDLARAHARIHARAQAAGEDSGYHCAPCDKRFALRRDYELHLKYTKTHAKATILKYKCSACDKEWRTQTLLRDHYNFHHLGQTQHCCPVCNKAVASKRSIKKHMKRCHQGVKDNNRDHICQTCGKAFRNPRILREHELIHTGEKPLSCDVCGRSFRQKACLYTHKRLVHKVALKNKPVHTPNITADDSEIHKNDD